MPRLDDILEEKTAGGTNFQYSATRIDKLDATEYTLVTIVQDTSGSVSGYKDSMEQCLREIILACKKSPRADNLMLRFITFSGNDKEEHGFKLLSNCNPDDYLNSLVCGGMTALYDASYNAIKATADYGKNLVGNDFTANAIVFVITDGDNNASSFTADSVAKELTDVVKDEYLESIITVLIGIGLDSQFLDDCKQNMGFTQQVGISKASKNKLAKLAEFVSRSVSSQSQSLGTGGPSQQISLTL